MTDNKADRFNQGKAQWHYLLTFSDALEAVARVSEHGAAKYSAYNYLKGAPASEHSDSALRHLSAYWGGEDNDPSSGQPHLAHACWNLLRWLQEETRQPSGYSDDRAGYKTRVEVEVEAGVEELWPSAAAAIAPLDSPGATEPAEAPCQTCNEVHVEYPDGDFHPVDQETGWRRHKTEVLWVSGPRVITAPEFGGAYYKREDNTVHATWFKAARHMPGDGT